MRVRPVAIAVFAVIAVLAVLGVVTVLGAPESRLFHLGRELSVPAFFSGILLAACGCWAAVLAGDRFGGRAMWALAALFAVMALDEVLVIHEHLEAWVGVDWQVLYAPVVLVGAVAFLAVARLLPGRGVLATWLGGAAAWGVSVVLERLSWSGDRQQSHYVLKSTAEEVFEMTGSGLWLCALAATMAVLRSAGIRPAAARVQSVRQPRAR